MHLNHNFCSNPRPHIQGLGISLLIFYTFFSKEIKTFRWISSEFWSKLVGYESGFLVNLLITTIWENSHLSPSFFDCTASIPYPFISLSSSSLSKSSSEILQKAYHCQVDWWEFYDLVNFVRFDGLQVCYSVFQ